MYWFPVSAIIPRLILSLLVCTMCYDCPGINWYERLRDGNEKLEICRQVISSSTRLQNTSRKERAVRMNVKCTKMKILRARRATLLFFIIILIKFVKLMSPSSLSELRLLKLLITGFNTRS